MSPVCVGPGLMGYLFHLQNFHIFRMIFLSHGTRVHHNRTVCMILMYHPERYTTDEGQMKYLFLKPNYQIILPDFHMLYKYPPYQKDVSHIVPKSVSPMTRPQTRVKWKVGFNSRGITLPKSSRFPYLLTPEATVTK